ncbi:MAG: phosphatase PAP2 family protein [Thermoleophilia bacterium]
MLLFIALTVAYEWVRDLVAPATDAAVSAAFRHAHDVVRWESDLGLHAEGAVQRITHHIPGGDFATKWYYTLAHTPGFITFFVLLWWFRKPQFAFVRNWFWTTHLFALTLFWRFPTAPPRFQDASMHDTTRETLRLGGALDWFQSLRNEYAAVPSLHIGYNVLYALTITWVLRDRGRWRYLAWLLPAWMAWVTMATANHYWFDGVAGAACVLAALGVVHLVSARDIPRPWQAART